MSLTGKHVDLLKAFIDIFQDYPHILHREELSFFKQFVESMGGKIPMQSMQRPTSAPVGPIPDVALSGKLTMPLKESQDTGILNKNLDQPMGDPYKQFSEGDIDKANLLKRDAILAYVNGDYEKATNLYSQAILLNPTSGLLFERRGQCYLMLKQPQACIKDCTRALEINPNSAPAYKFRGRARQLLEQWDKAAEDFFSASNFELDEQTSQWMVEVSGKIEQRKAGLFDNTSARPAKEVGPPGKVEFLQTGSSATDEAPVNIPKLAKFYQFLHDPEVISAFKDPDVAAALEDISANPCNIFKYQANSKISNVFQKLNNKVAPKEGKPPMVGFGSIFPTTRDHEYQLE